METANRDSIEGLMLVGNKRGYSLDNLIKPLSNFEKDVAICSQCKGLLHEPMQHCKKHVCQLCNYHAHPISDGELCVISEAILGLDTKCPLQVRGCRWTGALGAMADHLNRCEEFKLSCPQCEVVIVRKDMNQHTQHECSKRQVTCVHCKLLHLFKDKEKHGNECQEFPVTCTCGENEKRKNIHYHKQNNCIDTIVECEFNAYGCEERFKRRDTNEHNDKNERKHDRLKINYLEKRIDELATANRMQHNQMQILGKQNQNQIDRINELEELASYSLVLDWSASMKKIKDIKYQNGEGFQIPGCDIKFSTRYALMQNRKQLNLAISVWRLNSAAAFSYRFWVILVDQESGALCKDPAGNFMVEPGNLNPLADAVLESSKIIAKIPLGKLENGNYYKNGVVNAKIYCRKY